MHYMNYRLNFLVLYGGLVMNLRLLSVYNLLLMDDRLLLDYSSRRNLRVMEHTFMDHRLLNNLFMDHRLLNNLFMNHMSWLSNIS